jgi:hypothetical protein
MNRAAPPSSAEAFQARVVARLAVGFVLDVANFGRHSAPLLDALLLTAILDANVARVTRDPALQLLYARVDTTLPDELRRPVSINALAESLRLPFETVRRHVRQLIAAGLCATCPQGVLVLSEVASSPSFLEVQQVRYARILRFYDDLRAVQAIEPLPFAPRAPDDPHAPVRAVGRILSDYFFRTLDVLRGHVRDPLNGLIFLQVTQMNAEHMALPELVSILRRGPIPDAVRVPVRTAAVARRLRLPYETTRRHIGWLVEDGVCRRTDDGVVVKVGGLQRRGLASIRDVNLTNVRRLFRQFAALEGDAEPAVKSES